MKKILIILTILLLCGCTDYRELTDMSIVTMIGIDKTDKYNVIVQVLDYNGVNENKEEDTVIYKNSATTIHEALRGITLSSPKKLYLGHVEVLIVSKKLASEDITCIFDFILRDAEMEKDFSLILTDDIEKIMNTEIPPEIPSTNITNKLFTASFIEGSIHNVTFDTFVENTIINGIDPVLPIIYVDDNTISFYPFLAIFYDNKLEAYLDNDASVGYNIINNYLDGTVIPFKCDDKNYASIEMTNNNTTKMSYDINTNTIIIDSNIKGALSELNCNVNLSNNDEIKELNNKLNERISNILLSAIKSNQKYNSDFLGIENLIYKNYYKFYKNNDVKKLIKNSNIKINVNTTFTSKGSIKIANERY